MAEVVNMPRLSDTMEEGTVAKWFKKVGDFVKEGDILAEIETDKATMEFESFQEGELLHIGIEEGGTAPVDSLLAIIGENGEDLSALVAGLAPEKEKVEDKKISIIKTPVSSDEKSDIPAGVEVITMPRLSDTMEEGTVAKWNKKVGDKVSEGDILAEIETDKATMEFESFYSGVLLYIGLDEGDSAPVDSVLAAIGEEGTDSELVKAALSESKAKVPDQVKDIPPPDKVAEEKISLQSAHVEYQKPVVPQNINGRLIASPLAKKLAEEKGVDLGQIQGTGEGGRIVKRDIEGYKAGFSSVSIHKPSGVESTYETVNNAMRKAIAKRLCESKFSAPHYYLSVELIICLLYTSPSPRDATLSRMPSSA